MLNLDSTQKDAIGLNFVLKNLDCSSPYGMEKLKELKPYKSEDFNSLEECFDNMKKIKSFYESDKSTISKICDVLAHFKNIRGIIRKLENTSLNQVELFEIKNFLLIFEEFLPLFEQFNDKDWLKNINFSSMTNALDILDPNKKRIAPFSIEDSFSEKLFKVRQEKYKIELLLKKDQSLLLERSKIVAEEDTEETKIMAKLSQNLRNYIADFYANINNLGKLDFTIAKVILAAKYKATRPKISNNKLVLKNMQNPMVAEILKESGKKFTKTSLELNLGTTIITGANMGGKSVSLKTTVLNISLCLLGFFVFADEAEIPMFSDVCLVFDDMQDQKSGLSSFGAEITKLNDIVEKSKNEFLFIALDELARATNPQEGTAIVRAVSAYFSSKNCICLMSTHYDGVVQNGIKHYQVAGLLNNVENANNISDYMDYSLIEVDTNTKPPRDALRICKLLNMDKDLLLLVEGGIE